MTRNPPVALNPGDRFRIGDYEFEIIIEDESLAGNPLTANEETMTGADPFDDPFPAAGTHKPAEPFSHADPFDDDPFAEVVPDKQVAHADDDFMSDLDKPLSSLGDNPLAGHVSIDSLMGFDDAMGFEEPESAAKLEQRRTPLREAFSRRSEWGTFATARTDARVFATAGNGARSRHLPGRVSSQFPDDWDAATGMLKIPQKEEPFGSAGSDLIPDDWDEATGMLKVQAPPAPPRAVTPAPCPTAAARKSCAATTPGASDRRSGAHPGWQRAGRRSPVARVWN